MLLVYCDMLNIENQHLFDSNEELSCQVLHLETALKTLESRILHVDHQMEHCLSSHVHRDGSVENPFTLEGGDLRVSVMFDLTNPLSHRTCLCWRRGGSWAVCNTWS